MISQFVRSPQFIEKALYTCICAMSFFVYTRFSMEGFLLTAEAIMQTLKLTLFHSLLVELFFFRNTNKHPQIIFLTKLGHIFVHCYGPRLMHTLSYCNAKHDSEQLLQKTISFFIVKNRDFDEKNTLQQVF